jgi:hypothetical protein
MPGNELEVVKYLLKNKDHLLLKTIGKIVSIGAPKPNGGFKIIDDVSDIESISSHNSSKKADIYINGKGVSIKQKGSSFSFNRLQRANLLDLFERLGVVNPIGKISKLDKEVNKFHNGELDSRSRKWNEFLPEKEFKELLKYLMLFGSPNLKDSKNPAELILEAPLNITNIDEILVYSFDDYFEKYKNQMFFAIRRVWYGQSSDSEHKRSKSLMNKIENKPWVYDNVSGLPSVSVKTGKRWRDEVLPEQRKTIYIIFVEKK